jgi:hypothetical protein
MNHLRETALDKRTEGLGEHIYDEAKFAPYLSIVGFLVKDQVKMLYNACPETLSFRDICVCTSPSNEVTHFSAVLSQRVRC